MGMNSDERGSVGEELVRRRKGVCGRRGLKGEGGQGRVVGVEMTIIIII